jgi:hypothetical protein
MSPVQVTEVPEEFICPITHCIMKHPMMTQSGISFEKRAILRWLDSNESCPITRTPLPQSGLVSNRNLQFKIMRWKSRHSEEKGFDCDDNPATENVTTFLGTFNILVEKEILSDLEGQFATLGFEEGLDMALAIIES